MELIDIKPGDRLWNEVWKLYEESFPRKERRSADAHAAILDDPHYRAKVAVNGNGGLLGLLFYWESGDYLYIEHLAINQALRGQNIGSRLLEGFLEANAGREIILEIDPPEDEISIRRLNFYKRLGFKPNDYHFIHPGFGRHSRAIPHRLVILSYPDLLTPQQFGEFERHVNGHITAAG